MAVYAKIENGKLLTAYNGYNGIACLANSPEICLENGFIAYDEELVAKYHANMAIIQGNQVIDITDTDEYKIENAEIEKVTKIAKLQSQIEELDKKRIRAGFELSIKDEHTNQTYLEYYTEKIVALRTEIRELQN